MCSEIICLLYVLSAGEHDRMVSNVKKIFGFWSKFSTFWLAFDLKPLFCGRRLAAALRNIDALSLIDAPHLETPREHRNNRRRGNTVPAAPRPQSARRRRRSPSHRRWRRIIFLSGPRSPTAARIPSSPETRSMIGYFAKLCQLGRFKLVTGTQTRLLYQTQTQTQTFR